MKDATKKAADETMELYEYLLEKVQANPVPGRDAPSVASRLVVAMALRDQEAEIHFRPTPYTGKR